MKRIIILFLICLPLVSMADGRKYKKADRDTEAWRYEIEPVTVGVQGTVVVRISSTSKKPYVASNQAKKNAVHGVIFKGIPSKDRIPGKRALVTDPNIESENAEFFDDFFADGGEYSKFVSLTNDGALDRGDVAKLKRKNYKVSVTVTVNYDALRKYLEEKEIVKKLTTGF